MESRDVKKIASIGGVRRTTRDASRERRVFLGRGFDGLSLKEGGGVRANYTACNLERKNALEGAFWLVPDSRNVCPA